MRTFKNIALVLLMLAVSSCGAQKQLHTTSQQKDSVRTEIRYEKVFVKDTVYMEVPPQTAERTTQDSTSHLENDFAESDARINPDGSLYHDLKTKPQDKPIPFDKPVEKKDSVVYVEKIKEVEVPVPVEKELGWWEQTSIKWFPYTLGMILLAIVYIFRKPILSLIRRFI